METIEELAASADPGIAYKVRRELQNEAPDSAALLALQEQIRTSQRAQALLALRGPDGRFPFHPYTKWHGAHWTLSVLAEIGYPTGDNSLLPLRQQVYDWLFSERHLKPNSTVIYPDQPDRVRRCASMEGNAVWYLLKLGLADERVELLVQRLLDFQWPDCGWNCDKNRSAGMSSLIETIIPVRALALHGALTRSPVSLNAARRAAEVLLERRMFRRRRDGAVIHPAFIKIIYPYYVHYSYFFGLKVLAEAGLVQDPRCAEALDLLESKRLPSGGWPLENKIFHPSALPSSRGSPVSWGPAGHTRANDWVTAEALFILKQAGRN